MQVDIKYEDIVNKAPNLVEKLTASMLKKLSKDPEKSKNPEDWSWRFSWAQAIKAVSFQDILEGKFQEPSKKQTVEEEVYHFFKNGEIHLQLQAKCGRKESSCDFYSFKDNHFFIPQEIVNAYDENYQMKENIKKYQDYDVLFVYKHEKEKSFLEENFILCGLKYNDQNFIVLKSPQGTETVYEYRKDDNNLYAKKVFFSEQNIEKNSIFKNGNLEYKVISSKEVSNEINTSQMIRDEENYVNMLLQSLSKSKGFVQYGKLPTMPKKLKIPSDTPVVYMPQMDTEEKKVEKNKKFKIK